MILFLLKLSFKSLSYSSAKREFKNIMEGPVILPFRVWLSLESVLPIRRNNTLGPFPTLY